MLIKSILQRKGIRSDKIWTNPLLFREPFRRIPFYLDTYALMRSQYWPREELKKLGQERFAETVKNAAKIPFWKERFAKAGIDPNNFRESDIVRIPILTKQDFYGKAIEEYTLGELLPKSRMYKTSGSTGKPLNFFHDHQFELRAPAVSERMFRNTNEGKRSPVVILKRVNHLGSFDSKYVFFYMMGFNSVRHRIYELEKVLSRFPDGVILYSLGSVLLELSRVCQELGLTLPLRCVVSVGEELSKSQRMKIEEALHTRVRIAYGMSEIRQPAFECEYGHFHVTEEVAYFEVVDDDGTVLPSGERGRLVITGFDNKVMPFIRYDTGDIVIMSENQCQCRRTLRMVEFHGRRTQLLNVGNGRTVSLIELSTLFDASYNAIRQFQIIRTDECAFLIRIVPGSHFEKGKTENSIAKLFAFRVHPNVHIMWETVDSIAEGSDGKALYFIDKFKKSL